MPLFPVQPIIRPNVAGFYANPSNMQVDNNGATTAIVNGSGGGGGGTAFNIVTYGANPSHSDNTAAIQAAIDAAINAGGGTVYIPSTTMGYAMTGTLQINKTVTIVGDGAPGLIPGVAPPYFGSFLYMTASVPCIQIFSTIPVYLRDLGILYSSSISITNAAEAIQLSGIGGTTPSSNQNGSAFSGLNICNAYRCLHIYQAINFSFINSTVESAFYNIQLDGLYSSDATSSLFFNVQFSGGGAFFHRSSSAVRVISCGSLCSAGFWASFGDGGGGGNLNPGMTDYFFSNNGIENCTSGPVIQFSPANNGSHYRGIQIIDNEFGFIIIPSATDLISIGTGGFGTFPVPAVDSIIIKGNLFGVQMNDGSSNMIHLESTQNAVIASNVFTNRDFSNNTPTYLNMTGVLVGVQTATITIAEDNVYNLGFGLQQGGSVFNQSDGNAFFGYPNAVSRTSGFATLSAGSVIVNSGAVTNTSVILVSGMGTASTPNAPAALSVGSITATSATTGTFTIYSSSNTDTRVVAWLILQ